MYLIGDIGGTHSRLALGDADGVRRDTLFHTRNDDFDGLNALLLTYLDRHPTPLTGCGLALAGSVANGAGRLTNRDRHTTTRDLSSLLGTPIIRLINDLAALAHALPMLTPEPISTVKEASDGQSLVIGIGTGFNAAAVADGTVLETEAGHAPLPVPVMSRLTDALGPKAAQFTDTETLFSGRGLTALHSARTGQALSAADILAESAETRTLFACALADLLVSLTALFLPRGGIYLAGSVARAVMRSPARAPFLETFRAGPTKLIDPAQIPVALINDDAAALTGCLRVIRSAI